MADTIMVIEDEDLLRKSLERFLKRSDYKVYTAKTGKEALDILGSQLIDGVLLDVKLPDIDGLEITSGRFKTPTISASLTDGAPTDAQIDSATGTTPSAAGAGAQYIIIDSDGTGLVYKVISSGSSWFYDVLTEAT